jgi:Amt family ammonium transporter
LFSFFQLLFCMTVCSIVVGGGVERVRLRAMIPFAFVRRVSVSVEAESLIV